MTIGFLRLGGPFKAGRTVEIWPQTPWDVTLPFYE